MGEKILQGPKFNVFIKEKTVGEFFFKRCEKYSDRICQIDGTDDKTETYASVKLRSTRVALELQKRGVTSKDVITFCTSNTLNTIIPMLATAFLGAKITNLESSLSVQHTQHLVFLTQPKVIFVEEAAVALIEESLKGATFKTEIVVFGKSNKYTVFSDLVKPQEGEDEFTPSDVDPDDIVFMFFSSGTTGLPKAICHSHSSILFCICCSSQTDIGTACFHFTSFYWITAMMVLGSSFTIGSYRVFCRNPKPEDVFRIIEKYKVETIFAAPILTYKLTSFEEARKYDISSVKLFMCGGTSIAPAQLQKMRVLFSTALVCVSYGMSEVGVIASFPLTTNRDFANSKLATCGRVAPGIKLKVVDPDTGKLLGRNEKGELRLTSSAIMKGYYKTDSSEVFDEEGFLKTGDVGYFDEDDCVYVVARIKEMFKYQSWHIIPSAIEAVLLEHPSIKELVVFGLPAEEEGEVPAACVILEDGRNLNEEEIDVYLKDKVADRERLRGGVTFVDALPKTPTGKINRMEVKDFVMKIKKK